MRNRVLLTASVFFLLISQALSQIPRERADTGDAEPQEIFRTPHLVGMGTVESIPSRNLNVTIMHNFGVLNEDLFENFIGMDLGATVRLGIDYGITDRWSVGVGRTSPQKLFDFRTKIVLVRQSEPDSRPVSIAMKGDLGINTVRNGSSFSDRLNFLLSAMIARSVSDRLSLQVTPMYAHFNAISPGEQNSHLTLGFGGEYSLSDRWAIIAEYYYILGERPEGTENAVAIGVDIETGGHVFQLFLKSSNWHTEQHIISRNSESFWNGDIRFGFNVNRIFGIGSN